MRSQGRAAPAPPAAPSRAQPRPAQPPAAAPWGPQRLGHDCPAMVAKGRPRGAPPAAVSFLVAAVLANAADRSILKDGEPWLVMCNMDCHGVNTCQQKNLCSGNMVETGACTDNPKCLTEDSRCPPVPCIWGAWEEWSNDGVSGLCTRSRSFTPNRCGGEPCNGTIAETTYCDPVKRLGIVRDCEFSEWGQWGLCDSATLQRSRNRKISTPAMYGGRACSGPLLQTVPCGVRESPVDCELASWMAWSGCSRSCGGGQQTRLRAIKTQALRGGKLCGERDGSDTRVLQLTRPCNEATCGPHRDPVDCELGSWAAWGECLEAERQMYRERQVTKVSAYGGKACHSPLQEVQPCTPVVHKHTVKQLDCRLSAWTPWTLCSRTCEGGQTQRKRRIEVHASHGGSPCQDATAETTPCNDFACSADPESKDCALSVWSQWSSCSADCGQGLQRRNRTVRVPAMEGGIGCSDPLEEARPCEKVMSCDQDDCKWGNWSTWSTCTKTCGAGHRSRSRDVQHHPSRGGKRCEAFESISEVEGCNVESCVKEQSSTTHKDDKDCKLGTWTPWEPCSKSCNGVTYRKRVIEVMGSGAGKSCGSQTEAAPLQEILSCNTAQEFIVKMDAGNKSAQVALKSCGFEGHEPADCNFHSWGHWSTCSVSCDGGQRERRRSIKSLPKNGGTGCEGPLQEVEPCAGAPCIPAEDCLWGDWEPWSNCSRCDGHKIRVRQVVHQGNGKGKICEEGPVKEVERCQDCPADVVKYCVWGKWVIGECSATCGTGGWRKKVRELVATEHLPKDGLKAVVGKVIGAESHCEGSQVNYVGCQDLPKCEEECQPQDCQFGSWTEWSEPTKCDGLCRRQRRLRMFAACGGRPCSGPLEDTKECVSKACLPTKPCQLSAWTTWTPCKEGNTQRTRERKVESPAGPEGQACDGMMKETAACTDHTAAQAADCKFGNWSAWSDCSSSCGNGHQESVRKVLEYAVAGGKACEGPLRRTRSCLGSACGAKGTDCQLGHWADWLGCEKGRVATRKRTMTLATGKGRPCNGTLMETGPCPNTQAVACRWAEWAQWGECGLTCGGGQRFRTREVGQLAERGGKPCEGESGETESCNVEPCSKNDCEVSSWGEWSACAANCGQGQQTRKRQVIRPAQPRGNGCNMGLEEVRGCKEKDGPCYGDRDCVWGSWTEWSGCFKADFCGIGYRKRTRAIKVPPEGVGKPCKPLSTEEVHASAKCPGSCDSRSCIDGEWAKWGEWAECSVSCGAGGMRMRRRELATKANECGRPAEGESSEYGACSAPAACDADGFVLKQDCIFGLWTAWAPPVCPASCNGAQERTRTIIRYSANGGKPCGGATSEVARCNPAPGEPDLPGCTSGAPVDCVLEDWSDWSECSAECGTGHRARRRFIAQAPQFAGKPCENPLEEIHECNATKPCIDWSSDCRLSNWEEWGSCDPLTGEKVRSRSVQQMKWGFGKDCEGSRRQVASCPRECQEKRYICEWAVWEPWSQCSTSCGPEGRRKRSRILRIGGEAHRGSWHAAQPGQLLEAPQVAASSAAPTTPRRDVGRLL